MQCNTSDYSEYKRIDRLNTNISITDLQLQEVGNNILVNPLSQTNSVKVKRITSLLGRYFSVVDLVEFSSIENKIRLTPFTTVEIADFIINNFYNEDAIIDILTSHVGYDIENDTFSFESNTNIVKLKPSKRANDFLINLNNHLNNNFSSSISGDFCSIYSDVFAKALKVKSLIDSVKGRLDDLKNLGAEIKAIIKKAMVNFNTIVDKVKEYVEKQIKNVTRKVTETISNINGYVKELHKHIAKKVSEIESFFSKENMDNLKTKAEGFISKMVGQFEEINGETVLLILYRLCQLNETIQSYLKSPLEGVKTLSNRIMERVTILKDRSELEDRLSRLKGLQIENPDVIRERKRVASQTINRSAGPSTSITPSVYIPEEYSTEEILAVTSLTADGNSYIAFKDSVKSMGINAKSYKNRSYPNGHEHFSSDENYPDAGWKEIVRKNPVIYAMLTRVSKEMGTQLRFNSCFRSRFYNRVYLREVQGNNGAAFNSPHMSAIAIDISYETFGLDRVAQMIKLCSQMGFNRIACYNSFMHVDIRDTGGRGNWTSQGNRANSRSDVKTAMRMHLNNQFRGG